MLPEDDAESGGGGLGWPPIRGTPEPSSTSAGTAEGVVEDDAEAAGWYRPADQGDAIAQHNLGWMYANGEGVLQDNVTAHMWFNIAGANGAEFGRDNREKIEWKMTPADISEAQKRARICMASNYTDCE